MHEFDELRFDIRAHDCNYFLRAGSVHEKQSWVEAIEANKVSTVIVLPISQSIDCHIHEMFWVVLQKYVPENGFDNAICRQGSVLSLSGMSQASSSSFKV